MFRFLVFFLSLLPSQALPIDVSSFCLRVIKYANQLKYPAKLIDHPTPLVLETGETLKVEEYFASGRTSMVGRLESLGADTETIVKKVRDPMYEKDIEGELEFWNNNIRAFKGRVVPVLKGAKAQDGTTVLFKPYISGDSLWNLVVQKQMDNDHLASLKNLILWARTYKENVGVALDINPLNIVWVNSPKEMSAVGLSEPAFVFYELTPSGSKIDSYLYNKILDRVRSYQKPESLELSDIEALLPADPESARTLEFKTN